MLNLNTSISNEFVDMMRYLQFTHVCIGNSSTIQQIQDGLKYQFLNGAKMQKHYLGKASIIEMIECMGQAQKTLDLESIASSEFFSICEDAQKLNKVGARGFVVNCFSNHKAQHLFSSFMDMKKDSNLPFAEMKTIDDGKSATGAMITFIGSIGKSPIQCISMALDGDGTNMGHINGVKGRV